MSFATVVKYGEDPQNQAVYSISVKHSSGIVFNLPIPAGMTYFDPLQGNTSATEEQLDDLVQALMDLLDGSPDFSEVAGSKIWNPQYFQAASPTP